MGLTWWPVAAAGLCALVAVVVLTVVLPLARARRRLRPLAHVDRLTGLPEYARIRQREIVSAAITLALLVILFGTAVLTAARPSGSDRDFEALHPEDIMLCVADPVTEDTTAQFLDYYARQSATFDTQRIGLTSTTVRVSGWHQNAARAWQVISDMSSLMKLAPRRPYPVPRMYSNSSMELSPASFKAPSRARRAVFSGWVVERTTYEERMLSSRRMTALPVAEPRSTPATITGSSARADGLRRTRRSAASARRAWCSEGRSCRP